MLDIDSENEFNDWLESIEFINEKGAVVEPVLTDDVSSDPENDRGKNVKTK